MTFTTVVAAGASASADLQRLLSSPVGGGDVQLLVHGPLTVAWSTQDPWISTHDDGDVFVLFDGRLHEPWAGEKDPARYLANRYRGSHGNVAAGLLGDFILIVLDRRQGALQVSRDPVGVRPWYLAQTADRCAGAGAVASLCAMEWVDASLDEGVALGFLAGRSESRGPTFHRGIATLAPGGTWRWIGGHVTTYAHFTWNIEPEPRLPWAAAVERTREVFATAVLARVQAAGDATSELSGGLDSSGLVGTLRQLGAEDIVVGRLLFDGPSADERQYSNAVLDHWGLSSLSTPPWIPTEDEATTLTTLLRRPTPGPNFTMFKPLHEAFLDRGRRQAMTGLGGDDAFVAVRLEERIISALQMRHGRRLAFLAKTVLRAPAESWRDLVRPTLRSLAPWVRPVPPGYIRREAADRLGLTDRAAERPLRLTGIAAIDARCKQFTSGYWAAILQEAAVVGDLNQRRSTHPFLDPRFVTATFGLDPWFAAVGGHSRALEVEVFSDRLPPAVAARRTKAEFSEVVWPTALQDNAVDRLLSGPLVEAGWLDLEGFSRVLSNARAGEPFAALPLWRALALDRFMRNTTA